MNLYLHPLKIDIYSGGLELKGIDMSHKRHGQLATSGEWAKHLRPPSKRDYWKRERAAEADFINLELKELETSKVAGTQVQFKSIVPKSLTP
jgi:hypothetical protein